MNEWKTTLPEAQSGHWKIERFTVEPGIETMRLAFAGRPVTPGQYTRLTRRGTLVMSDTPAEIRDLGPFAFRVSLPVCRRILINGLGLGIALQMALKHKHVASVDVVEISPDVINLVGGHVTDPRVTIHNADALEKEWAKGVRWNVVWHDIWDNCPNGDDLPSISKLKRKYGRRCDWQGVWCEHFARRRRSWYV